jgi:hypothetical protein
MAHPLAITSRDRPSDAVGIVIDLKCLGQIPSGAARGSLKTLHNLFSDVLPGNFFKRSGILGCGDKIFIPFMNKTGSSDLILHIDDLSLGNLAITPQH